MNSILINNLKGITSASVEKYLLLTGWEKDDNIPNKKMWIFSLCSDPSFRIAIPSSETNADFYARLFDVIETLSDLQGKKETEIINSMKSAYTDRMQFRIIAGSSSKGKIPLSFASQFVEGLRDLVLYSACAVENAQPVCTRAYNNAKSSLDKFQFGQTEYGSFIFNVDVQVASEENEQYYLADVNPPLPEPTEHKVVERIKTAFDQVDSIATRHVKIGDIIDTAFQDGMTANICEAMLMLRPDDVEDVKLETTFHYAEALTHSTEDVSKCTFENIHFLFADEVSKRYRDYSLVEDVDVHGKIVMLARDAEDEAEPENTVRMAAEIGNVKRNITLHLSPRDHTLACNAYRDNKDVRVVGTVDKSGRFWFFESIKSFSVED